MFRADDYVKVSDLAEAYELCQKRSSLVVGGMVWMKMTHITKRTIVDLSGLGCNRRKRRRVFYWLYVQFTPVRDP